MLNAKSIKIKVDKIYELLHNIHALFSTSLTNPKNANQVNFSALQDMFFEWKFYKQQCSFILEQLQSNSESSLFEQADIEYRLSKIDEILSAILQSITFLNYPPHSNLSSTEYRNILPNLSEQFSLLKDHLLKLATYYMFIIPNQQQESISPKIISLEKDITTLESRIKDTNQLAENSLNTIADAIVQGKEQLSQMQLGQSFLMRAKTLDEICKRWLFAIIFLLVVLIVLSGWTIWQYYDVALDNMLSLYIEKEIFSLPLFIAIFWSLWFVCKQYANTCRLRDDYHYKYDLSTAFYGYNNEVKQLADNDKTIPLALLDIVLKNIGTNPAAYRQTECNSPYAEIIEKIQELINKVNREKNNINKVM